MDAPVEQVDPHEGQVRRGFGRLLHEAHDAAVVVELGHPEALGVGHPVQEDLGGGVPPVGGEGVDQLPHPVLEQVVPQVHDEVVVAEERAGDEHAVGQPEG